MDWRVKSGWRFLDTFGNSHLDERGWLQSDERLFQKNPGVFQTRIVFLILII